MKNKYLATLILLVLNILCIFAVDFTTFRHKTGGAISGNGNPGIIAVILGLLFLIIFLVILFFISAEYFKKISFKFSRGIVPSSLIIIVILMLFAEGRKIHLLEHNLNGFTNEKGSIVYRFGWVNQYTNSLFYNGYILIFGVALTILASWVYVRTLG